jgi:hypothetical protein
MNISVATPKSAVTVALAIRHSWARLGCVSSLSSSRFYQGQEKNLDTVEVSG